MPNDAVSVIVSSKYLSKQKVTINASRISKDSNTAVHSVDSDIFYVVIHLPGSSKAYIKLYFLKKCEIMGVAKIKI